MAVFTEVPQPVRHAPRQRLANERGMARMFLPQKMALLERVAAG